MSPQSQFKFLAQIGKDLWYVSTREIIHAYLSRRGRLKFIKDQYKIVSAAVITISTDAMSLHHINSVKSVQSHLIAYVCSPRSALYCVKYEHDAARRIAQASAMKLMGIPTAFQTSPASFFLQNGKSRMSLHIKYLKKCSAMFH